VTNMDTWPPILVSVEPIIQMYLQSSLHGDNILAADIAHHGSIFLLAVVSLM
jgi:hypothetical protein